MVEKKTSNEWSPPFCANDTDLKCPACGAENVCVREKDIYYEGEVEAYCGDCHAMLEVQANVEITFSDPDVAFSQAAEIHACGGTILVNASASGANTVYVRTCDICSAFRYLAEGPGLPSGTDKKANLDAWEAGRRESPDARCSDCDPSFDCFDGSAPCCKRPLPLAPPQGVGPLIGKKDGT